MSASNPSAAGLKGFLAEQVHLAAGLFEELKTLSEEESMALVLSDERYAHPGLVKHLMDLSHSLRYENPKHMLHWASLARIVADRASIESVGGEPHLFDLKIRAWGHLGNSLRVCGHIREAQEILSTAHGFLERGSGDQLVKARLLELQASLHIFLRDFDRAIQLAQEAGRIMERAGEEQLFALNLVVTATAYLYSGDPETAITLLNRSISLINGEEDPHLLLAACHNLVRCYIDLALPEQGLAIYRDIRELYRESADTLILLRLSWQEGQLLHGLNSFRAAHEALSVARNGFQERGLAYEAAVVSLDLAAVQRKLGLRQEAQQTVADALPTFRALHVDRETLASLILAVRPLST